MKCCIFVMMMLHADDETPNCILLSSHPGPVHIPSVAPVALAHAHPRQDQCPTQSSWRTPRLGFLPSSGPQGTLLQEPSGERPGLGRRFPAPSGGQPSQHRRLVQRVRAADRWGAQRGRDPDRQPSNRDFLLQLPEGGGRHPYRNPVHHQEDARRGLHPGHHSGVEVRRDGGGPAVLHSVHGVHDRVVVRVSAVGAASPGRLTTVLLRDSRELVAQVEYNVVGDVFHWRRERRWFAGSSHIHSGLKTAEWNKCSLSLV